MTHIQKRGDGLDVGAISKFRPENPLGTFTTVITNLPSFGGGCRLHVQGSLRWSGAGLLFDWIGH